MTIIAAHQYKSVSAENAASLSQPDPAPSKVRTLDLVIAELRKLLDTRAGLWLHVAVFGLITLGMVASYANPYGRSGMNFVTAGSTIAALLLPMTAILSLTSEWAQGSVAATFALVPRRSRIICAKLLALSVSTLLTIGYVVGSSYLATIAARAIFSEQTPWNVNGSHLITMTLGVVVSMLMGAAFGATFMSPAIAIVVYLVLPLGWSGISQTVPRLAALAGWLDTSATFSLLLQGTARSATDWAKVAVSVSVWVLVPLLIGLVRLARREIK